MLKLASSTSILKVASSTSILKATSSSYILKLTSSSSIWKFASSPSSCSSVKSTSILEVTSSSSSSSPSSSSSVRTSIYLKFSFFIYNISYELLYILLGYFLEFIWIKFLIPFFIFKDVYYNKKRKIYWIIHK